MIEFGTQKKNLGWKQGCGSRQCVHKENGGSDGQETSESLQCLQARWISPRESLNLAWGTEDMEVPGPYCVKYVPGPVAPSCSLIEEMPCAQNLPLFLKYLAPLQKGAHSKHVFYYVTINFDHG